MHRQSTLEEPLPTRVMKHCQVYLITIKGTQTGTVSDANGNYSIRAQRGNVLEFTFVGMVKQSVTVGKQNVINIQMAADAINLDEVVAIGYGIAKRAI